MMMGTVVALAVIAANYVSPGFADEIKKELGLINFPEFILGILLSFLLFAGSLHVRLEDLKKSAKSIASFAIFSTLISTFAVGAALYYLLQLFNHPIPFISCFLFGALISPTDPIAVMGILKKANLSK